MLGKTHFLGGVIAGYAVSPDWKGILIGGSSALLSDMDEPNSIIGQRLGFISRLMKVFGGHRTFTHSAFFTAMVYYAIHIFSSTLALIVASGIVSHLILDMLSGRILLFWPFKLWIGIPIPHLVYRIIDLICRISLILYLLSFVFMNYQSLAHLLLDK